MDTDIGLPDAPMSAVAPAASRPSRANIPGFFIERSIGSGAMGQVYQARQISLDRVVALKVLPRALALRSTFVNRFHEESAALAALNHPNIVTIIDRGHVGSLYYFAMELVDGPTLAEPVARDMDCGQVLSVGMGVASALMHAHASGVIHRD
ncbi:MAG: protein kinase, partial [Propionibacteriaceae bacterium]|nr:protein kinase [Propionibacteriaceae bacterium]